MGMVPGYSQSGCLSSPYIVATQARVDTFSPSTRRMLSTDSEVVVMTTEILRNIMYRTEESGSGSREDRLANVGLVVLDEVPPYTLSYPIPYGQDCLYLSLRWLQRRCPVRCYLR